MRIDLPIIRKSLVNGSVCIDQGSITLDLDTSVYSEERWEKNFPALAEKEGLFQYIERVHSGSVTDRVKVACMLKAIYCFVESNELPDYKSFAMLFDLAVPEYTEKLITCLKVSFEKIIGGSSTKNLESTANNYCL